MYHKSNDKTANIVTTGKNLRDELLDHHGHAPLQGSEKCGDHRAGKLSIRQAVVIRHSPFQHLQDVIDFHCRAHMAEASSAVHKDLAKPLLNF